jgi:hypothetical protein
VKICSLERIIQNEGEDHEESSRTVDYFNGAVSAPWGLAIGPGRTVSGDALTFWQVSGNPGRQACDDCEAD